MTYKLDFQTVFQIWTNSDISHFSFRHFRKQNEKPITVFICIHVMLSLLSLTVCQSALHKWCWDVSSGPCHNIMWEQNLVCTVLGRNADVWWEEAVAVVSLPAWAVRGPRLLGIVKSKPPLPLDIAIVSQIRSCISSTELKVFFIKIHLTCQKYSICFI